jgi:hypothetical protein
MQIAGNIRQLKCNAILWQYCFADVAVICVIAHNVQDPTDLQVLWNRLHGYITCITTIKPSRYIDIVNKTIFMYSDWNIAIVSVLVLKLQNRFDTIKRLVLQYNRLVISMHDAVNAICYFHRRGCRWMNIIPSIKLVLTLVVLTGFHTKLESLGTDISCINDQNVVRKVVFSIGPLPSDIILVAL